MPIPLLPLLLCLPLLWQPAWAAAPLWEAPLDLARGPAERGPWRQNDSHFRYVDDGTVRYGPDGQLYVAWVDQRKKDVLFQRLNADHRALGPVLNISHNRDTFSWLPRIATLPGQPQVVLVLWQEILFAGGSHGGDILLARSEDGGQSFSDPLNLSMSVGGDGKGRINREHWHNGSQTIAAGPDGLVHAAWTEYDGQLWYARSTDAGAHFGAPRQLGGNPALPARAPSLAVAADGKVFLAFTTGEDPASDIQLMHSDDQGRSFSPARKVDTTPGYSDTPRLAVDAKGVLHLAWAESEGGPFKRSQIRYARSQDGGNSFEAARTMPAAEAPASQLFPALAVQQGRVLILWEVAAQAGTLRHGLVLAVSDNGGADFAPPMPVPHGEDAGGGSNGSLQGLPDKLAMDEEGRIAIVNSAFRERRASRVWLLRGRLPASAPTAP